MQIYEVSNPSDPIAEAERRAELECAGYQITQKRDGGWWWSDRYADDGPFEGNDEALPDESAAIDQAWQHMKRGKTPGCESCLPGVPCVLHGAEPDHRDRSFDTPAARRRDIERRRAERSAVSLQDIRMCGQVVVRVEEDG